MMKYVGSVLLFLWAFLSASAQQNHFVYIQTENKQPFYVRISDRLLSSSSSGYVVIPKLKNGTYDMHIGFPKNEWPTQKISLDIKDRDEGFVLKDFDEKGWGLFNMQTLNIVMSAGNRTANDTGISNGDGFADVLADVVSTPSIRQKPVEDKKPVKEEKVTKSEAAIVKKEELPVITKEENPAKSVNEKTVVVVAATEAPAKPQQILSTLDQTGRSLIYIDTHEHKPDTIRIFISYAQPDAGVAKREPVVEPVIVAEDKKAEVPIKKEDRFIDMEVPDSNASKPDTTSQLTVFKESVPVQPASNSPMVNSDCKAMADNDDFLKLRKKMAAQKTDENMIVIAKKAFHTKCYSTEQINNLSVLFLKDEGRYNFFDAAYPRVSDSQNFGQLSSRLSDEYYLNRFKAMIR